ncbi:hypothetical protein H4R99_001624 [Coemansia sp. RSA 1722]|nr:hypothetical protein H4R99_001624 [Coemansia sp. RSA 1722]
MIEANGTHTPQGNGAIQATNASSAEELLALLRAKLAKHDQLETEIAKLGQEQTTLENYVANMMASNQVNYTEDRGDDTEESEFELSEEEEV